VFNYILRRLLIALPSILGISLVLVHGGMAQNVGPILEMVTEKYLLRSGAMPPWTRTRLSCSRRRVASVTSSCVRTV